MIYSYKVILLVNEGKVILCEVIREVNITAVIKQVVVLGYVEGDIVSICRL